jgi:hypothetical protein
MRSAKKSGMKRKRLMPQEKLMQDKLMQKTDAKKLN